MILDDLLDLLLVVAELLERHRHGLVDDLHHAAADQLLVLDQRDVRLDAGGVAVHHEADRAGRREHRGLRVAEAVLLAELDHFVPDASWRPRRDPSGTWVLSMSLSAARCLRITRMNGSRFFS